MSKPKRKSLKEIAEQSAERVERWLSERRINITRDHRLEFFFKQAIRVEVRRAITNDRARRR